jgi:DNA-binding FrmR family transcriptional regulator
VKSSKHVTKKQLSNRLKIIEGQIRGVNRMIDDGQYCVDILNQLTAIKGAINRVEMEMLRKHTVGCVSKAIQDEKDEETVDELLDVIFKLIR